MFEFEIPLASRRSEQGEGVAMEGIRRVVLMAPWGGRGTVGNEIRRYCRLFLIWLSCLT